MDKESQAKRIAAIDFARGIALIGILLINMMSFHSPYAWIDPYTYWQGVDSLLFSALDIFVGASFYPLFSLLFGYGTVKIVEKSSRLGLKPMPVLGRRFTILLLVGMIHAFLIWNGDILITYAVSGFVLLLFLKRSAKTMIHLGVWLLLIMNLLLFALLWVTTQSIDSESMANPEKIQQSQVYGEGSYWEITTFRVDEWWQLSGFYGFILVLISIVPLFLIGAGLAKLGVGAKEGSRKSGTIAAALIIAGLLVKILPYLTEAQLSYVYLQDSIGGPILAGGYFFLCIAMVRSTKENLAKTAIIRAGRMSLTVYLSQSIIGTLLFYQYGFGLYGQVQLWQGTVIALLIYVVQLTFCYFWFNYYRIGPLEWGWRWLTYGEKPALKNVKR